MDILARSVLTAEMDNSAGSVPAGPNFTGGLGHGHFIDENNILHLICEAQICPDYK